MKGWLAFTPVAHQAPGPHGIPLLSHAVVGMKPAMRVFQLLLEQGANVSAAANNGMTPLMMAARGQKLGVRLSAWLVSPGGNWW